MGTARAYAPCSDTGGMKQIQLIPRPHLRKEHGGTSSVGKRRRQRPLSVKTPLHLVLRSDFAFGSRSLVRHRPLIEKVIKKAQNLFHIRIYEMAIVSNHIHIVVKGKRRRDLQNFFRVVAGHIAQEILREFPILPYEKARGGGAPTANLKTTRIREKENKFWQTRIYSRIVSWGREYLHVKKYVIQNTLEALGLVHYKIRAKKKNPVTQQRRHREDTS